MADARERSHDDDNSDDDNSHDDDPVRLLLEPFCRRFQHDAQAAQQVAALEDQLRALDRLEAYANDTLHASHCGGGRYLSQARRNLLVTLRTNAIQLQNRVQALLAYFEQHPRAKVTARQFKFDVERVAEFSLACTENVYQHCGLALL